MRTFFRRFSGHGTHDRRFFNLLFIAVRYCSRYVTPRHFRFPSHTPKQHKIPTSAHGARDRNDIVVGTRYCVCRSTRQQHESAWPKGCGRIGCAPTWIPKGEFNDEARCAANLQPIVSVHVQLGTKKGKK